MKFLVDMVPINPIYECPFADLDRAEVSCKLDDNKCECDAYTGCRWLAPFTDYITGDKKEP